jgi:hypothetical protein
LKIANSFQPFPGRPHQWFGYNVLVGAKTGAAPVNWENSHGNGL